MPRKGWPLAPAFGGSGLDGAWRSAEVCRQEIDGEVWPRYNFKPLVFSQFRTAVDNKVQLSVAGPNVIAPLLCNRMSLRVFEELLEQDAISFVVWEPYPLLTHKDGKVKATFNGRIDLAYPVHTHTHQC